MTQPLAELERSLSEHFKVKLRQLRARSDLTQDQVAAKIGVHESAVSRWEKGARFPGGAELVRLAETFQVSVDFLLGRDEQYAAPGTALLDQALLDKLDGAATTEEFDRCIAEHEDQAVWLPVPDGAVLVPVGEAMRRTRRVADKHKQSRFFDRLFRPRL